MPDTQAYIIIAIAIFIIAVLLIFIILKRKDSSSSKHYKSFSFDIDKLINALGNKENVKAVSSTISKVTFELEDYKKVEINTLKELGASGIVENNKGLNVIFGKNSPSIEEMIKEHLQK